MAYVSTHYNLQITYNQLTVCYLQKKGGLYRRMLKIEFTRLNFKCHVYMCGLPTSLTKTALRQNNPKQSS